MQFFFPKFCTLGKSLLKAIANRVLKLGLNCCKSAPTGKSPTTNATDFPNAKPRLCIATTLYRLAIQRKILCCSKCYDSDANMGTMYFLVYCNNL